MVEYAINLLLWDTIKYILLIVIKMVNYTEAHVISKPKFLIDNTFVEFGGRLCQQIVGIPVKTNCAPLLVELFLFSYESEFLQTLVINKKIKEVRLFYFAFRYIEYVFLISNPYFSN